MPTNVISQPKLDRLHNILLRASNSAAPKPIIVVRARQAKKLRYSMTWLERYVTGEINTDEIHVTVSEELRALALQWQFSTRNHSIPCLDGTVFADLNFSPRDHNAPTAAQREEHRLCAISKADAQLRAKLFAPLSPTAEFRSAFTPEKED